MLLENYYLPEDSKGLYEPKYFESLVKEIELQMSYENYNYTKRKVKLIIQLLNKIYFHYPHELKKILPSLGFEGSVLLTMRLARQLNFGFLKQDLLTLKTAMILKRIDKEVTAKNILDLIDNRDGIIAYDHLGLEELTEHALELMLSVYDDMFYDAAASIRRIWDETLYSDEVPDLKNLIDDEFMVCQIVGDKYHQEMEMINENLFVFPDFSNYVIEIMIMSVKEGK